MGGWPDNIYAPSAIPWDNGQDKHPWYTPRAMTLDEIRELIDSWVAATKRAIECGFDLVEIHAAHGYLINQFLSPLSNKRTDAYGGSFQNRIRLLIEVTKAVRDVWPAHKPLSVRLSCTEWVEGGWDSDDTVRLSEVLLGLGVDIIDASSGGNDIRQKIPVKPSYQLPFAAAIKKRHGSALFTAAVGMITEPKQANDIVESGEADLILMAREFLRDPKWPLHAAYALGVNIAWPPQYDRARTPINTKVAV